MLTATKYNLLDTPQSYWKFIDEYGNIYNSKEYLEWFLANGMNAFVVAVYDQDEIVGGLTVTLGGKVLNYVVNATAQYGPIVKDRQKAGQVLTCIAQAVRRDSLFFSVCAQPQVVDVLLEDAEISRWQKRRVVFMNWDISTDLECIWKDLPRNKRRPVTHAKKEGVTVETIKTAEQIEQFYKLHTMTMTRDEKAAQPSLEYFNNLFKILGSKDLMVGFLALHPQTQESIVGGVLLLGMHKQATYLATGQDYAYRNLCAADFLMWHCLQFLKDKGYTMFDLVGLPEGKSPRAEGIRYFKTTWTGANGRKEISYVLTHRNIKWLNPTITLGVLNFLRKVSNYFTDRIRGK